jgi:hypothetical protein
VTDAEKAALIKKLGSASNSAFDSRYSPGNRKWFVGKIIAFLTAQGVTAGNVVEERTGKIIKGAGDLLKTRIKKGFSAGGLASKWALYNQLTSRTQIIYGMVAMHPQFLEPANASYFDFILERRYKAIQRMAFYVNPNDVRNVFAYPEDKPMKLNKDATAHPALWRGAVTGGLMPFLLTSHGTSNPSDAIDALFNSNKGADRNLLACDPVATVLHLDALSAAKNPDTMLKALANEGEHYLKIDHPDGHLGTYTDGQVLVGVSSAPANAGSNAVIELGRIGDVLSIMQPPLSATQLTTDNFFPFQGPDFAFVEGVQNIFKQERFRIAQVNPVKRHIKIGTLQKTYGPGAKLYVSKTDQPFYSTLPQHFLSDTRPDRALFDQLTVKAADLQVGDHIYVLNHPIYRLFYPAGIWGGEHSFISEIGSRDVTGSVFRTALKVEGHGLNNTLLGMVNEMLEENNIVLAIMQSLARIHLGNLEKNGRPTAAGTVNVNGFKFKFLQRIESAVNMNVFEYDMPYEYSVVLKGNRRRFPMTGGFVIKEVASAPETEFRIWSHVDKDSVASKGKPLVASFAGAGSAEQFKLSKWVVKFFNTRMMRFETHALFKTDNRTPNPVTFDDVVKSKPFFTTDDNGDAYVVRPRVNFDAAYQAFLTNNGAI